MKIGLTGGIGSGKSTIATIFKSLNYAVFNSDDEAKKIMNASSSVKQELLEVFGSNAYLSNGQLNRTFLAGEIFNSSSKKEVLEKIIHPKVREAFRDFALHSHSNLIINEAAILFETGAYKNFDKIIYVTAPKDLRIARVQQRDQISREEVESKIANQNSDEQNLNLADFVIVNDGEKSLIRQVLEIIQKLN